MKTPESTMNKRGSLPERAPEPDMNGTHDAIDLIQADICQLGSLAPPNSLKAA
ncbi:MAG: hypothetical protein GX071_09080 [Gammaproteobacteria bacterium]|nr:hypothetical protein [Gammaproteobacteria bacterium]